MLMGRLHKQHYLFFWIQSNERPGEGHVNRHAPEKRHTGNTHPKSLRPSVYKNQHIWRGRQLVLANRVVSQCSMGSCAVVVAVVNHFYTVLFSTLKQTHPYVVD